MKKGKIFTKGQIAVAAMFVALGLAVWLNVKYSGNDKYMGETTFVSQKSDGEKTAKTSAKATSTKTDYFETAIKERDSAYEKIREEAEETLKSGTLTDNEKKEALKSVDTLSNRIATAQNIEALLKAKGFEKAVAVLSNDSANIVVSGEKLTDAQTLQIQDIVTGQTNIELKNIKIVAVK